MDAHKRIVTALLDEIVHGSGPVVALCACHASTTLAKDKNVLRPGDVYVVVHPEQCGDHIGDCHCNKDDNIDTSRIT